MNPEWLRYYLGAKLNGRNEDIDFNPEDFMARVNADLIGKYVNIASRAVSFIAKRFGGRLGTVSGDGRPCWPSCAPSRTPSCRPTKTATAPARRATSCYCATG